MLTDYLRGVIAATVFVTATATLATTPEIGPTTATAPATTRNAAPYRMDARFATPITAIRTLALAIKAGDSKSIRQCIIVKGHARQAAVVAFAHISAASEHFSKVIVAKLGNPPAGMDVAFGSIDASMDRLLALLPKAVIRIHHVAHRTTAEVTFPASSTGKAQVIFVRRNAGAWKVDGTRLLHLNRPGITTKAVLHRANQLNLLAAAIDRTTDDIKRGTVTTWTNLEKDMELHILEAQATMEASRSAPATPPVMAAFPAPAGK